MSFLPPRYIHLKIIRQDPDSGLNAIYDEWFAPYTPQSNLFTINSLQAMVGMAVAGFGVACMPEDYFAELFTSRKLIVARTTKAMPSSLYCAMYAKQSNTMFYQEIARIAREVCDFSQPYGGPRPY